MSHITVRAVLFDMDGVVADTEEAVTSFWRDLAAAHSLVLTQQDFINHIYGVPASHTLDALFPTMGDEQRTHALSLMYEREAAGPYKEIAGARPLLTTLQEEDIATALVTSARPIKVSAVCEELALEGLFSTIVTGDDIERGKPDPEGYLLASDRIGVDAAHCLVFEDSLSGVMSAISAGAKCMGVTSRERAESLIRAGATVVVPDLRSVKVERRARQVTLVAGSARFDLEKARKGEVLERSA